MGRYFAKDPATGLYADITYQPHPASYTYAEYRNWYIVFVGQTRIGNIMHVRHPDEWTAISGATQPHGLRKVDGFARRWAATEYLLRAYGIWKEDDEQGPVPTETTGMG